MRLLRPNGFSDESVTVEPVERFGLLMGLRLANKATGAVSLVMTDDGMVDKVAFEKALLKVKA